MAQASSQSETLRGLKEQLRQIEGARRPAGRERVSTGVEALDRLLPAGGLERGTVVEWLSQGEGAGAATLALVAAREACREGGVLVVIDRRREFYPPAAAGLGVDLERLILVRPGNQADENWALDQVLRTPGIGAVMCRLGRLDSRTFRRLQLAAEAGGALGMLVRPASLVGEPSWASVRLMVEPRPSAGNRRMHVEVIGGLGGAGACAVDLELDGETGEVRAVAAGDSAAAEGVPEGVKG